MNLTEDVPIKTVRIAHEVKERFIILDRSNVVVRFELNHDIIKN